MNLEQKVIKGTVEPRKTVEDIKEIWMDEEEPTVTQPAEKPKKESVEAPKAEAKKETKNEEVVSNKKDVTGDKLKEALGLVN